MPSQLKRPPYHFIAYVDESGDDGLKRVKPIDHNGSSEWLVLSAVVVSAKHEANVVRWAEAIKSNFRNHQKPDIHFAKLNSARKSRVCTEIADLPLRCFVVASNKKNMRGYRNKNAEKIPSKNWFYCWMTRVLLERVTDFVYKKSMETFKEPKKLKIEYSERGGLSYSQMAAYYEWLRMKSSANNLYLSRGDIAWSVMDWRLLDVYNHKERAGLQLADCVASAFFKACDLYDTGECDPSFAKLLKPRMGRIPDNPSGQISGYGVKLLPGFHKAKLLTEQQEIFRFYGYPSEWWAPAPSDPPAF